MHPKLRLFLYERDRAYARQDDGIVRSMNAELRRLGIPDDATLAHPAGKPSRASRAARTSENAPPSPRGTAGHPKPLRCEHENVAERCAECNPELAAR